MVKIVLSGGLRGAMGPEDDSPWTIIECVGRLGRIGEGRRGETTTGRRGFGCPGEVLWGSVDAVLPYALGLAALD